MKQTVRLWRWPHVDLLLKTFRGLNNLGVFRLRKGKVFGKDGFSPAMVPWQYHSVYSRGPPLQSRQGWELPPAGQRIHTGSLCPLCSVSIAAVHLRWMGMYAVTNIFDESFGSVSVFELVCIFNLHCLGSFALSRSKMHHIKHALFCSAGCATLFGSNIYKQEGFGNHLF